MESLDGMWPQAGDTNSLQVIEADGSTVRTDVPVVALQRRDGTDGMTYFYFMKNETDDPDDYYVTSTCCVCAPTKWLRRRSGVG